MENPISRDAQRDGLLKLIGQLKTGIHKAISRGPQQAYGNPGDPPPVGNTYYIQGFGTTLTKVTRD